MSKRLFRMLLGLFIIGGIMMASLTAPHTFASSHITNSIPGCADWDYSCGYIKGFAAGRTAALSGLCANSFSAPQTQTASERGYRDAFSYYCQA